MTEMIISILSRVLSEELAHQENWKFDDEIKGFNGIDRDEVIKEVKAFMKENNIPFAEHHYFNALEV